MDIKAKFGLRLKELRKNKNISQEHFAELIGITPRNLSKIETGQTFPSCVNLEKIINALEVEPETLFSFSHHSKNENLKSRINEYLENLSSERLVDIYKIIKALIN